MCILLVERVVNVAVPLILGLLVDILEGRSSLSPWIILLGFVCLRFLQGSGGLAAIRDVRFVFLCVELGSIFFCSLCGLLSCSIQTEVCCFNFVKDRISLTHSLEMSQLSFDHILNLSFAWHTRRKTGEILRVLDRGAAINHTLEVGFPDYLVLVLR